MWNDLSIAGENAKWYNYFVKQCSLNKVIQILTIHLNNLSSSDLPRRTVYKCSYKYLYVHNYTRFITWILSVHLGTTQMAINLRMDLCYIHTMNYYSVTKRKKERKRMNY